MSTAILTPGADTLYRVWLRGRLVCATNSWTLAARAHDAAERAELRASLKVGEK